MIAKLDQDPEVIKRRIAYLDTLRGMHKNKRLAGLIGCLVGVLFMLWGTYGNGPGWARWVGLGIVAPSWFLFIYVVFARALYARLNPFDPGN